MAETPRYICIHGHFYQPPRENPWLEEIELQDSAHPFHDWNERISAECYSPNATARILDGDEQIVGIVSNYSRVSFNFGPTLLSWLERRLPATYQAILASDEESKTNFSGHGSALAQAYNHMIMPLATLRDKRTQVIWGLQDFAHRFKRPAEGMWLPETGVDTETLEVLAECGLRFTILSPYQAAKVRAIGDIPWHDVSGGRIDPTRPYRVFLPSGRTIDIFFYDGPIAKAVAFEKLLRSGEAFAHRILGAFNAGRSWPQLVNIATDGETYGHHHPFGDMGLAYALHYIESKQLARLTNYGEYLEKHPPTHEVRLLENSSWSCVHGIERWRAHCGCCSGGFPGWNQNWRGPLREALDWLRDTAAPLFERSAAQIFQDPWRARDGYIGVILDRNTAPDFLAEQCSAPVTEAVASKALKLLELQRQLQLMYTSCGWFFDEVSGLEPVQILRYASRAVQLAENLFSEPFEAPFLQRLEQAKSNIDDHQNARRVYEKFVRRDAVDLKKVAAHFAISSLYETYPEETVIYSYCVKQHGQKRVDREPAHLVSGTLAITSGVTQEQRTLHYCAADRGDLAPICFVIDEKDPLPAALEGAVRKGDVLSAAQAISESKSSFSLASLFYDKQRQILGRLVERTTLALEPSYRTIFEHEFRIMQLARTLGNPLPSSFAAIAEWVLNLDLRRAFAAPEANKEQIEKLLTSAAECGANIDTRVLGYRLKDHLEQRMASLAVLFPEGALPEEAAARTGEVSAICALVEFAKKLPFTVNLFQVQNQFYELMLRSYPALKLRAEEGDAAAGSWCGEFSKLGKALSVTAEAAQSVKERKASLTARLTAQRLNEERALPQSLYRLRSLKDPAAAAQYAQKLGAPHLLLPYTPHAELQAEFPAYYELAPAYAEAGNDRWWHDVLMFGQDSRYASLFEIDWSADPDRKIVLACLEAPFRRELERGAMRIVLNGGRFMLLNPGQLNLPLSLSAAAEILLAIRDTCREASHPHDVIAAVNREADAAKALASVKQHDAEFELSLSSLEQRLDQLFSGEAKAALALGLAELNGQKGKPDSMRALSRLIERQHYRLLAATLGAERINFRKAFGSLLRPAYNLEKSFEPYHARLKSAVLSGRCSGAIVKDCETLDSPAAYLAKLQRTCLEGYLNGPTHASLLDDWERRIQREPAALPLFVAAVGADDEMPLPAESVSRGECSRDLSMLFLGLAEPSPVSLNRLRFVLTTVFRSEFQMLCRKFETEAHKSESHGDLSGGDLKNALAALIPALGAPETGQIAARQDAGPQRSFIEHFDPETIFPALRTAREDSPETPDEVFDYIEQLLHSFKGEPGPVRSLLQLLSEVRAVARREDGLGELVPEPGASLEAFHQRFSSWTRPPLLESPEGDVYAGRLDAMEEMKAELELVRAAWTEALKDEVDFETAFGLLTTLLCRWPVRLKDDGLLKAGDPRFTAFLEQLCAPANCSAKLLEQALCSAKLGSAVCEAARRIAFFGSPCGLSRLVLRMTLPGIPVIDAGSESGDPAALTERRLHFGELSAGLDELEEAARQKSSPREALLHLHVTSKLLALRNAEPELFNQGSYTPLRSTRERADFVIAYERKFKDRRLIVGVQRFPYLLLKGELRWPTGAEIWGDSLIEHDGLKGSWKNVLTNERLTAFSNAVPLEELFKALPVAVLTA